ncbi:hypothetical protein HOY82DRAFT_595323 [Tuber indicum]|nr:hypothetical protein HOY82DRAFT_595323 [Tuber indicum]
MGEREWMSLRARNAANVGIGRERLLAGEAEADSDKVRGTIQPGTLRVYQNAQALGAEYQNALGEVDCLFTGGPLPALSRIMGWLRWLVYTGSYARWYISRPGNGFHPQSAIFVTGDIALPGMPPLLLPIEHQEKPIFDIEDLKVVLTHLWCCDKILFHEDRKPFGLGLYLITLFLALAFADNAFEKDLTPESICYMRTLQDCDVRTLAWKRSAHTIPVIRQVIRNGMVSDNRGMTYNTFIRCYQKLLRREGFQQLGSPYSARCFAANAIEDKLSSARIMQVMGHKDPKVFSRHYISSTTFAEVESLVQGEEQRLDLIRRTQRMGNIKDDRAPQELPKEAGDRLAKALEPQERELAEYRSNIIREYRALRRAPRQVYRIYTIMQGRLRDRSRRLNAHMLDEVRRDWFTKILATPEGPRSSDRLWSFSDYSFTEARRRIAMAFFGGELDSSWPALMHDLIDLCGGNHRYGRQRRCGPGARANRRRPSFICGETVWRLALPLLPDPD